MAFDAVSAPPPPPAKAATPAAKADAGASQGAGGAAQSPFGALMAILDAGQATPPAAGQPETKTETAPPQGADAPGKAVQGKAGQDKTAQGQTDQAQAAPTQTAQAPVAQDGKPAVATKPGQTVDPGKITVADDGKDDAKDAGADPAPEAAPVDAATLMAGLLVAPLAQTAPQADRKPAAAPAADGKPAPAAPQLDAPQAQPDPKLAAATPEAPAKPGDEATPAAPAGLQAALDAAGAAQAQTAASDAGAPPSTGDLRRAQARMDGARTDGARTGETRDPTGQGASAQLHQASREAGGQAGGQAGGDRPHDRSAEPQATGADVKTPAAATEMAAQPTAPETAGAAAPGVPAMGAPGLQQLAATSPALIAQAAAPVRGSPETVAHLAAQMIQRLEGQNTQFDLALNPQNLGRVDVRIQIDHRGALKASMAFDTPEAARQFSSQQGELRAALEKAGFDLADGALSFDVSSGGQQQGQGFADGRDSGPTRLFQAVAEAADPSPATPSYFTRAAASGVDIRI